MKKLKNQQGATILMALLLLLVASMVSVVVLTAATTAARSLQNDRESQQSYLSVSSAAELVRDEISADSYVTTVTKTTSWWGGTSTTTNTAAALGAMAAWLNEGVKKAAAGSSFSDTIILAADTADNIQSVTAVFQMADNMDITVSFSLTSPGNDDCRITLKMTADKKITTNTVSGSSDRQTVTTTTTAVTWGAPRIEKGAG